MPFASSSDGTSIAFDREGAGPALILVDGALCHRAFGPARPLAALLTKAFTVFTYDRRGRGESGDSTSYSLEREIEDFAAVLHEAGGRAFVYGISSGAALAMEAANRLPGIQKLAVYEAPFIVDASHSPLPADFLDRLKALLQAGHRSDAVKLFMRRVGTPGIVVAVMPLFPVWTKLKAVAHTLVYDISLIEKFSRGQPLPMNHWTNLTMPSLVMDGGKSPVWMRNATRAISTVLPNARYQTLEGQTHMLKPDAIAPVLIGFFTM